MSFAFLGSLTDKVVAHHSDKRLGPSACSISMSLINVTLLRTVWMSHCFQLLHFSWFASDSQLNSSATENAWLSNTIPSLLCDASHLLLYLTSALIVFESPTSKARVTSLYLYSWTISHQIGWLCGGKCDHL